MTVDFGWFLFGAVLSWLAYGWFFSRNLERDMGIVEAVIFVFSFPLWAIVVMSEASKNIFKTFMPDRYDNKTRQKSRGV